MKVHIKLGGESHSIDLDPTDTILDAALNEGLNPPFSCLSGNCTTCAAKLISGEVSSEAQTDEGTILTCQAKGESDEISIEYL